MVQRVQDDVDPERVRIRREPAEAFIIFALPLPAVRDIGIVRHEYERVPVAVENHPEVGYGTVRALL